MNQEQLIRQLIDLIDGGAGTDVVIDLIGVLQSQDMSLIERIDLIDESELSTGIKLSLISLLNQ